MQKRLASAVLALVVIIPVDVAAQAPASNSREWYISWGYNAIGYTPVDIHLAQPGAGTDVTLHDVRGHDQKGWTDLFHNKLTGVQYSVRIGYFFTAKQDLALEVAFDHPRFIVTQNQSVQMSGKLQGGLVDEKVTLTEDFLKYKLNNGANILLFDLVKRLGLRGEPGKTGNVSLLLRAGVGFDIPHPTNVVFGDANDPSFQMGGVATGVEAAVRLHFFRTLYLEFAQKGVYARYPGLQIHEGSADQVLWAYISALSLGTSLRFR
jgi:hypothetical protein